MDEGNKRSRKEKLTPGLSGESELAKFIKIITPDDPLLKELMLEETTPFDHNPFFTGRASALKEMHSRLRSKDTDMLALCGPAGVGKTQLTQEYANHYKKEYKDILWLNARNRSTFFASCNLIAFEADITSYEDKNQSALIKDLRAWLEKQHDWLLIADDITDLELLRELLPAKSQGHVLLTTREPLPEDVASTLAVEPLTPENGALLLLRRTSRIVLGDPLGKALPEDRELALQIARDLEGFPLALNLAGAYIKESKYSLADFQQMYQKALQASVAVSQELAGFSLSLFTVFSLTFFTIEALHPAAQVLLRFCAFLAPDDIPERLFLDEHASLGSVLGPVAKNEREWKKTVDLLEDYGLLTRESRISWFSLHPLVQQAVRILLPEKQDEEKPVTRPISERLRSSRIKYPLVTRRQWADAVIVLLNTCMPKGYSVEHWDKHDILLPHIVRCLDWIRQEEFYTHDAEQLTRHAGMYLLERVRPAEAEPLLGATVDITTRLYDKSHPNVALDISQLGDAYALMGQASEAEKCYKRALALIARKSKRLFPTMDLILRSAALFYLRQKQNAKADDLFRRLFSPTGLRKGDLDDEVLAEKLNLIGHGILHEARYEEAEFLFKHALELFEQQGKSDQLPAVGALGNLALTYKYQGRLDEAESLYLKSLEMIASLVPPDDSNLLAGRYNLANLYAAQGRYEEAEPLMKQCYEASSSRYGTNSAQLDKMRGNLGMVYNLLGRYEEAEKLLKQTLTNYEKRLGVDHPETIELMGKYMDVISHLSQEESQTRASRPLSFKQGGKHSGKAHRKKKHR